MVDCSSDASKCLQKRGTAAGKTIFSGIDKGHVEVPILFPGLGNGIDTAQMPSIRAAYTSGHIDTAFEHLNN